MEQLAANQIKTALYPRHLELGAKMINFHGWLLPLQYRGVVHEHHAVREKIGLFDVSHMGRISLEGKNAGPCIEYLSTNIVSEKAPLTATYTVFADENGLSVDDAIVYKVNDTHFFTIVNGANRQKDLAHLKAIAKEFGVTVTAHYHDEAILAVQGPKAVSLLSELFPEAAKLKPFHFLETTYAKKPLILSHTGYTGSGGMEIYTSQEAVVQLWDELFARGKTYGIEPIGLGARDTLRLEKGYALYGHELSDAIAPTESISAWTVKFSKADFLGKNALEKLEHSKKKRSQYGIILTGSGIAREGCDVQKENQKIGVVTSGSYSPTLKKAIAIVMVEGKLNSGEKVDVIIRGKAVASTVTKLPFLKPHDE